MNDQSPTTMSSAIRSERCSLRASQLLAVTTLAALVLGACDLDDGESSLGQEFMAESDDPDTDELGLVDPASAPEPLLDDEPVLERPVLDLTTVPDPQAFTWKGWISEEQPASTCSTGQIVAGFDCDGSRCDNIRIECHNYGGTLGDNYWSIWFSEEAPNNFHICSGDRYITGVTCSGSNCDNLSLECTTTALGKSACGWVGPYSEEQVAYLAPVGKALAGIWCTGSNCDNKYYWVCNI